VSRTRTWSPWMCWSLEVVEVVLQCTAAAVGGKSSTPVPEL
jgi:hypothetical protein